MENEFIPCEICDTLIEFSQYMNHLEECQQSNHAVMFPLSFTFSNLVNQEREEGDENESSEDDEEIPNSFAQFRNMMNNLLQHMPNLENNYQNLSNLEDVQVPCKDIDKVAPLVPSGQADQIPDETICPICQEIVSGDARKTICDHYFCSACIEPWLEGMNKSCPTCSVDLDDLYQKEHPDEKYLSSDSDDSLNEFIQNEFGGHLSDPDDHSSSSLQDSAMEPL